MMDEATIREDEARRLLDFIYDAAPCWPEACTREQLLALYRAWLAVEDGAGEQAA